MNTQENKPLSPLLASAFDVLEMFCFAMFAVLLIFTFAFRLCRTDGSSMENTLHDTDTLVVYSLGYQPQQDDIVVFHLTENSTEKTLVKRVIATGGQQVKIDFEACKIYVDGVLYEDSHAVLKDRFTGQELGFYTLTANHHYDPATHTLSATVPEGDVFVLGDNRNNSKDSRSAEIGFVDQRCILGKVICRLSPFTTF